MENNRVLSKKVLFLYPHSVIQDQLMHLLVQSEFEVGLLSDYQKAPTVLHRFPSSIIFINIESTLTLDEWESYIRAIMEGREKHDARIGILTYNPSKELAEKYLMEIGVQCGFIGLKLGIAESAKIIIKTLEANEARGDRRFVRVKCSPAKTSINVSLGNNLMQGELLDISSSGLSCVFPRKFETGISLPDVQLKLWGSLVKVHGKVIGRRKIDEENEVHVIMFDDNLDRESKGKIYTFIQKSIQFEIDSLA